MTSSPSSGDIVHLRTRHYVVEGATPGLHGTVVDLACMDDDSQGSRLSAIWELELDGEIITRQAWESIGSKGFDPRESFAAFFNTLRWHCVTATDPRILQSPFRAGIRLDAYQLEPLRKALLLPRVNLFIADDVGLGKTIEAGLIASELLLRRRIDTIVVSCPPAMLGQWRDELETRFGLTFEILDREYLEKIRRTRGFGVNPWKTFPRFLVSQRLLIDEAYAAPLRDWLGSLKAGSLLILDEAHHAAPASGAKYAIDSRITRAVRDIASRFEHRLFLSATPHNGHSNSFSALLELLDPQRFTRGVPVTKENLEKIMVRRLKEDIRQVAGGFPKREIVQEDITGLPESAPELVLSRLLDEYAVACESHLESATRRKQIEFQLVISHLQQRLFSSIEAFARTLAVHRRSVEKAAAHKTPSLELLKGGIDREGDLGTASEEDVEAALDAEMEAASSSSLGGVHGGADQRLRLLDEMRSLAESRRHQPDARVLKLLDWMRENQCSGLGVPGKSRATEGAPWQPIRVIIFTEYENTLRYLRDQLYAAMQGTDRADARIEIFYGATPTDKREAIKTAFNADPATHPVRILLATDAAREGLNLQAHCHHLFHFDVPWNPSRLEQRNGRIDRKLQPAPMVFCHYFNYAQRPEDRILSALVRKTETIKEELGSLSQVLDTKLATTLQKGLRRSRLSALESEIESARADDQASLTVEEELESTRQRNETLRQQLDSLQRQLDSSRKALHFDSSLLQGALSRSLQLGGFPPLTSDAADRILFPVDPAGKSIDPSWSNTLDSLRQPPRDGKRNFIWRREAPIRPVTFTPPDTVDDSVVQLHLGHRISQRLLSRFLSQGFVHKDLSRACFAQSDDRVPRVVLIGRLGLYGPGASRLHEEILTVTARWTPPSERDGGLQPYERKGEARTMQILEAAMSDPSGGRELPPGASDQLLGSMAADVTALLPHLETLGNEARDAAAKRLSDRARIESEEMTRILEAQRNRVLKTLEKTEGNPDQLELFTVVEERRQVEDNMRYWRKWLSGVEEDLRTEPARIAEFYDVKTTRVEPVGIVYLWPA
jgi:superfamily II DNA or RNA helicase